MRSLLIQPSQIIAGEKPPKALQTLLADVTPKYQISLIPSAFEFDIEEYLENAPLGGSADFTLLWPRVPSTPADNSDAGG